MNKNFLIARTLCALLFACATGAALALPKSVKASYQGYMNGIPIGVINENFAMDGEKYRIESDTKATGVASLFQRQPLKLVSVGQITREGLKPSQFEGRRAAEDPAQVSATFDWSGGKLNLRHDGKEQSFPIQAGMQDRLSIMYQLMFWPISRMNEVQFALTNGRKLDQYRYKVNQEVEVTTPMGKLKTIHLVKQHAPGETGTEIWLSLQHQYFPVKVIYIEKDGMRFEQLIKSLEIRD